MSTNLLEVQKRELKELLMDSQRVCIREEEALKVAKKRRDTFIQLLGKMDGVSRSITTSPTEIDRSMPARSDEASAAMFNDLVVVDKESCVGPKERTIRETVQVPSSDHVAEIVGRQGSKIKALRTMTNTFILTPQRGAQPVFVITGHKDDVRLARNEILSAAEHFTHLRAARSFALGIPNDGSVHLPSGKVKGYLRVGFKMVGLVVGEKGATIKRISQITNTYVVTPNRNEEPVFEIIGSPDDVNRAKEEILHHINVRTGVASTNNEIKEALPTIGQREEMAAWSSARNKTKKDELTNVVNTVLDGNCGDSFSELGYPTTEAPPDHRYSGLEGLLTMPRPARGYHASGMSTAQSQFSPGELANMSSAYEMKQDSFMSSPPGFNRKQMSSENQILQSSTAERKFFPPPMQGKDAFLFSYPVGYAKKQAFGMGVDNGETCAYAGQFMDMTDFASGLPSLAPGSNRPPPDAHCEFW